MAPGENGAGAQVGQATRGAWKLSPAVPVSAQAALRTLTPSLGTPTQAWGLTAAFSSAQEGRGDSVMWSWRVLGVHCKPGSREPSHMSSSTLKHPKNSITMRKAPFEEGLHRA